MNMTWKGYCRGKNKTLDYLDNAFIDCVGL